MSVSQLFSIWKNVYHGSLTRLFDSNKFRKSASLAWRSIQVMFSNLMMINKGCTPKKVGQSANPDVYVIPHTHTS